MSSRLTKSGKVSSLFSTFTYFIPAPPARKSGYREREFDKIMQGILSSGFEIKELRTESVESGIFIFALLKATNKKVQSLDQMLDMHENFKLQNKHSSADIILEDEDEAE